MVCDHLTMKVKCLHTRTAQLEVICLQCNRKVLVDSVTLPVMQPSREPRLYGRELADRVNEEAVLAAREALHDSERTQ